MYVLDDLSARLLFDFIQLRCLILSHIMYLPLYQKARMFYCRKLLLRQRLVDLEARLSEEVNSTVDSRSNSIQRGISPTRSSSTTGREAQPRGGSFVFGERTSEPTIMTSNNSSNPYGRKPPPPGSSKVNYF